MKYKQPLGLFEQRSDRGIELEGGRLCGGYEDIVGHNGLQHWLKGLVTNTYLLYSCILLVDIVDNLRDGAASSSNHHIDIQRPHDRFVVNLTSSSLGKRCRQKATR